MKPHPRIRKTIKWGGAAVTVLLVMAWIGSGLVGFHWKLKKGNYASVVQGAVFVQHFKEPAGSGPQPRVYFERIRPAPNSIQFQWWTFHPKAGKTYCGFVQIARVPKQSWSAFIPLLPVLTAVSVVSGFAWWLDAFARRRERAARLNLCPQCRYDRSGLAPGAVCPECGRPAE